MTEGIFPKIDGDILYASEVNSFNKPVLQVYTGGSLDFRVDLGSTNTLDKNADFVGMFDYLNDKILKLQGFNLKDFASNSPKKEKKAANVVDHVENKDLHGFLPLKEGKSKFISYTMNSWEEKYKDTEIVVTKETVKK